jgi:hypothetical protein
LWWSQANDLFQRTPPVGVTSIQRIDGSLLVDLMNVKVTSSSAQATVGINSLLPSSDCEVG